MWMFLPVPILIGGGLLLLAVNSLFVGILISILSGRSIATPGRALVLLPFFYIVLAILYFGIDSASGAALLVLFSWPISILFILPEAMSAELFIFVLTTLALLVAVVVIVLGVSDRTRLAAAALGAFLAVIGPATLQNARVQSQMTRYAAEENLRVIERKSLFQSVRERSDAYQPPHGVACNDENWPYLWSYRKRAWIALPNTTRFGGDTPEKVMAICVYAKQA